MRSGKEFVLSGIVTVEYSTPFQPFSTRSIWACNEFPDRRIQRDLVFAEESLLVEATLLRRRTQSVLC